MASLLRFKAHHGDEILRFSLPTTTTFSELRAALSSRGVEDLSSTLIKWKDDEGDLITLQDESDFAELTTIAHTSPLHLHLFPRASPRSSSTHSVDQALRALAESLDLPVPEHAIAMLAAKLKHGAPCIRALLKQHHRGAAAASRCTPQPHPTSQPHPAARVVHHGVVCDRSGMNPIVGVRYHLRGADYDLCEDEFNTLPEEEKQHYEALERPRPVLYPWGVTNPPLSPSDHRHPFHAFMAAQATTMAAAQQAEEAAAAHGTTEQTTKAESEAPTTTTTSTMDAEAAGGGEVEAAAAAAAEAEVAAFEAEIQERVSTLIAMGFKEESVRVALETTKGSLERAADWLFENALEVAQDEEPVAWEDAREDVPKEGEDKAAEAEEGASWGGERPEGSEEWGEAEWHRWGLVEDLAAMGFDETRAQAALSKNAWDFKAAVKDVMHQERGGLAQM